MNLRARLPWNSVFSCLHNLTFPALERFCTLHRFGHSPTELACGARLFACHLSFSFSLSISSSTPTTPAFIAASGLPTFSASIDQSEPDLHASKKIISPPPPQRLLSHLGGDRRGRERGGGRPGDHLPLSPSLRLPIRFMTIDLMGSNRNSAQIDDRSPFCSLAIIAHL